MEETFPFRSKNLIDKMIQRLLEEGSDTLIAAIKESRGIWMTNKQEVNLINDKHFKKTFSFSLLFAIILDRYLS